MELKSTIKCPFCGFEKVEHMPVDYCVIRYTCSNCGKVLLPLEGDCCVFCSFGTVKCPSKQVSLVSNTSQ